jgi:hypothetical protein
VCITPPCPILCWWAWEVNSSCCRIPGHVAGAAVETGQALSALVLARPLTCCGQSIASSSLDTPAPLLYTMLVVMVDRLARRLPIGQTDPMED